MTELSCLHFAGSKLRFKYIKAYMLLIAILQCVSKYEILKNVCLPEIIHKANEKGTKRPQFSSQSSNLSHFILPLSALCFYLRQIRINMDTT
jgi:hypothetical protein